MAISSVSNANSNPMLQSQDNNTAALSLSQQQPPLSQAQLSQLSNSLQQAIQSAFQSGGSSSQIQSQLDTKVSTALSSAGISPANQQTILNNFNQAVQGSGSQHQMHRGAGRASRQAIQGLLNSQSTSDTTAPSNSVSSDGSTSSTSSSADNVSALLTAASSSSATVGQNVNTLV